jgi:cytoskeletal protein CcmA (bactofilin family)
MALGHSVLIKGDITAGEDFTISGRVEGSITASGHAVTLAAGSCIVGDVEAATIVVAGRVDGSLVATGCLRVDATAEITGDITSPRLSISDGALVHGRVEMSQQQHALTVAMTA